MKEGEMLHDSNFSLFEAMSALELMDPKMDEAMFPVSRYLAAEEEVEAVMVVVEVVVVVTTIINNPKQYHPCIRCRDGPRYFTQGKRWFPFCLDKPRTLM